MPGTHDLAMPAHDLAMAQHDLAVPAHDLAVPDLSTPPDLTPGSDEDGGTPSPDMARPPLTGYGAYPMGSSAVFFVENADWADLHYKLNGGGQLNVRMTHNATTNHNEYTVGPLSAGAVIEYNFTYFDLSCPCAKDSPVATYTHAGIRR
jgi:hypothetical protein